MSQISLNAGSYSDRKAEAKREQEMPFELRALEAALAEGVKVLEIAVGGLERVAFPTLENLIHNVRPRTPFQSNGLDLKEPIAANFEFHSRAITSRFAVPFLHKSVQYATVALVADYLLCDLRSQ